MENARRRSHCLLPPYAPPEVMTNQGKKAENGGGGVYRVAGRLLCIDFSVCVLCILFLYVCLCSISTRFDHKTAGKSMHYMGYYPVAD